MLPVEAAVFVVLIKLLTFPIVFFRNLFYMWWVTLTLFFLLSYFYAKAYGHCIFIDRKHKLRSMWRLFCAMCTITFGLLIKDFFFTSFYSAAVAVDDFFRSNVNIE